MIGVVVLEHSSQAKLADREHSAFEYFDKPQGIAKVCDEGLADQLLYSRAKTNCCMRCGHPADTEAAELEGRWVKDNQHPHVDLHC